MRRGTSRPSARPRRRPPEEPSLLDVILDSVADGVCTVDPDLRITYWNPAAEAITGVPASEALGRRCMEVFRADLCGADCPMKQAIATRRPAGPAEVEILAHGQALRVSVTAAALQDRDGRFLGGVESFRDASRRPEAGDRDGVRDLELVEGFVARSKPMRRLLDVLPAVARSEAPVLVRGGSGTGKELLARAIHRLSRRAAGPFVRLTGAAATAELRDAELRIDGPGEAGARPAWLEAAAGGTLFLDEISELSPGAQLHLAQVLDSDELRPLRSAEVPEGHVRLVASTREDIDLAVRLGRLRQDLLYRIGVIRIDVPSLSERADDLPELIASALERLSAIRARPVVEVAPEAMRFLLAHDYPGNLRELDNVLEHACIVGAGPVIGPADLPAYVRRSRPRQGGRPAREVPASAEKDALVEALRRSGWNRSVAAQVLGVHRCTLWRRMQRLGIGSAPEPSSARGRLGTGEDEER